MDIQKNKVDALYFCVIVKNFFSAFHMNAWIIGSLSVQ